MYQNPTILTLLQRLRNPVIRNFKPPPYIRPETIIYFDPQRLQVRKFRYWNGRNGIGLEDGEDVGYVMGFEGCGGCGCGERGEVEAGCYWGDVVWGVIHWSG